MGNIGHIARGCRFITNYRQHKNEFSSVKVTLNNKVTLNLTIECYCQLGNRQTNATGSW